MYTKHDVLIRKIFLIITLVAIALLPHSTGVDSTITHNQEVGVLQPSTLITVNQPGLSSQTFVEKHTTGTIIRLPVCFEIEQQSIALPKSRTTREKVPGPVYYDGCGATSGGIIAARLDRGSNDHPAVPGAEWANVGDFPNLYKDAAQAAPLTSNVTWTDSAGDPYAYYGLVASLMGQDGRTTRGTMDDYWVHYLSSADDPYISGGWIPHAWGDAIGDYMYTSQSAFGNKDGETQFWIAPGAALANCDELSSQSKPDGTLGTKQFYQARGYAVGACYNQQTNNTTNGGFSFANFKAEIDSGWPVLLGLQGHTVVGIGYNSSSNLIYLLNGWDYDVHTMEWKENCYDPARNCSVSYKYQDPANDFDLPLQFVSIVKIVPGIPTYYTISGNVGTSNATITYTGGFTTADNNGNYSFTVTESWFGTVAVSSPCYTFSPTSRSYSNAIANQTSQNYTASINLRPGCANINVLIAGSNIGSYALSSGASTRQSYAGVNNGPVKIVSTNSARLIGAERIIYKVNNIPTSFSEMMGLPASQLDNTYWMPWYNNVDLDTQLRFGNVSNTPATVHVWIGGVEKTSGCTTTPANVPYPYVLDVGASLRVSCPGVNDGPVKIISNVNIVAAERVIYNVNGAPTSFTEMMGLPDSQLNTTYWMPWYNNVDLDTQLRFGNVSGSPATVHVWIGGQEKTSGCTTTPANVPYPYVLAVGASLRVSCPTVNSGPVRIISNVNIVAAERVIYKINNLPTSFTEMMGLPDSQLNTTYWMPWYNDIDLDSQLRFGVP